jgi:hypothetical protein
MRSAATSWCDPFARNRSDPGDGRQRSPVSLVSNGRRTTTNFHCVSTSVRCCDKAYTETEKTSTPTAPGFGASSAERCRGVSIVLRREMLRQAQYRLVINPSASSGPKARTKTEWVYWSTRLGRDLSKPRRITRLLETQRGCRALCGLCFTTENVIEVGDRPADHDQALLYASNSHRAREAVSASVRAVTTRCL